MTYFDLKYEIFVIYIVLFAIFNISDSLNNKVFFM